MREGVPQVTLRILVIDDDEVDRAAIRRYLSRPGRKIVIDESDNGQDAMRLLADGAYDCAFLDYNLPDTDGISLLRRIYNADTDMPPAPIVMLTGQGNEAVMADALRWGAQDYLVKDNITVDTLQIALSKAREFFEIKRSRRRAEELLRQAQKMEAVGQLTSGVAHDFNNLLTIVLGNARLLKKRLGQEDEPVDRADLAAKVEAIDKAARRGAELIRRLMIFSRQTPLNDDVVNINGTVRETAELLQRSLGELVRVNCVLCDDVWPVRIDAGPFENALINIAVNARDAMGKGGTLTIETENVVVDENYLHSHPAVMPGNYVMIAISDTGSGIPATVQQRIFEPFYTTKPVGEGTGLGLAMVYGVIQQSGGHIHVYSEEGHGTVFRLYLPSIKTEDAAMPAPPPPALDGGSETILVVEDDPEVRLVTQGMLERMGYRVLIAETGPMALDVLQREHRQIDLIFTDIVMPGGMNGADLVRQAQGFYPGIKALYTSGYTQNAIPGYQLLAGEELLGKPYRKDALARKVREVLDRVDRAA